MATITCYLAGPMDDVTKDQARTWRRKLARAYPAVLFFDPSRAWLNATTTTAEGVVYGDRAAIAHSTCVLANLTGPGRGFGTIREIEFARGQGKPVAIAGELASLFISDVTVRGTLEEAMDALLTEVADVLNRPHPFMLGQLRLMGLEEDDDDDTG